MTNGKENVFRTTTHFSRALPAFSGANGKSHATRSTMISPKEDDDAPPSDATADDDTLSCKRPRGEEEEEKTKRTRVDELVAAEEKPSSSLNENNTKNDKDDDNNRSGGTALIRGLPSRWDERRFRLALHEMRVTGNTKVKKRTGWTHAFVTFNFPKERALSVSYTHLTLPTSVIV